MDISQIHKNTADDNDSVATGEFALVHGFGHYVFSLRDEYDGVMLPAPPPPPPMTPVRNPADGYFCTQPRGQGSASIMGSGPDDRSPANSRTEFCTDPEDGFSTSHETGYLDESREHFFVNEQQHINGESSWESIVREVAARYEIRFGVTMQEPTNEPTSDISSHQPIDWQVQSCTLRQTLSVDRSGSMLGPNIALAKQGAALAVDLAESGEEVGVTSFNELASVDFPLQVIVDDTTRTAAKAAINRLAAFGATSIGGGLQTALSQFTTRGTRSANEFIVLLSDGFQNIGLAPSMVIPALQEEGVKVFTIGLGANADQALLSGIADQTGGKFEFASAPDELQSVYARIASVAAGDGELMEIADVLRGRSTSQSLTGQNPMNRSEEDSVSTLVDGFATQITFVLSWSDGDLDLRLVTPDGSVIDRKSAASDPNVDYINASTYEIFRIASPQSGEWQARIAAVTGGDIFYNLQVFETSDEVRFAVAASQDRYVFPQEVVIEAAVRAGRGVAGADVGGEVTRPDGSIVGITLFDDGLSRHGDEAADDGIYSNTFNRYTGDGVYRFRLVVDNSSGVEVEPEAAEAGFTPRPIEAFTRQAQLAVPVSGVPAGGDADGDGVPDDRDQCLGSDLQPNIVIGGNDSDVANQLLARAEGCTMMDLIRQASQSGNRSEFLRGVALLTRTWLNDALISEADAAAIRTSAARADTLPLP